MCVCSVRTRQLVLAPSPMTGGLILDGWTNTLTGGLILRINIDELILLYSLDARLNKGLFIFSLLRNKDLCSSHARNS